jgi:hypothetical protein
MSTSSTATVVFTLVGTLGGVILTGSIGWLRTAGDHRHERTMKELETRSAAQTIRRAERREYYEEFLVATNGMYQLAADLFARARKGETLDFRSETRDVIVDLMNHELSLDLVASIMVRRDARDYVESLRTLLIDATSGTWPKEDTTKEPRNRLFKSMIADINPGEEPASSAGLDADQQAVPPSTTGAEELPSQSSMADPVTPVVKDL